MSFKTKLDFSNNRQIKQYPETFTQLSGGTSFGVPFSALTTGPDLTTTAATQTYTLIASTFSGNSGTTNYTWYDNRMQLGVSSLSALTPSNSGVTQTTGQVYTASSITTIDGNTVALTYTGVSFDISNIQINDLGGGNYSGSVETTELLILSAGTLDFTGRTIWVDVSGITRTQKLIITDVGTGPSSSTLAVDSGGNVVYSASDYRLKENISSISSALDTVKQLQGITYNWKDRDNGGDSIRIGFIAQEVKKIAPELTFVNEKSPEKYMGVHYQDVTALLVEAVKELSTGKTTNQNVYLETQTIFAEDNDIQLNYSGTNQTAIGGGMKVLHAIGKDKNAELITDDEGNWITNNAFKPKALIIPFYSPSSSNDTNGYDGNITRDDSYLYLKITNKWKRIKLEDF